VFCQQTRSGVEFFNELIVGLSDPVRKIRKDAVNADLSEPTSVGWRIHRVHENSEPTVVRSGDQLGSDRRQIKVHRVSPLSIRFV
jgi:hypothetical protein